MAKEELASILSGDPLPQLPSPPEQGEGLYDWHPQLDKFHRDLLNYLRRLTGRFTTENLPDSGGGDVDEFNIHTDTGEMSGGTTYVVCEYVEYQCRLDRVTVWSDADSNWTLTVEVNGSTLTGSGDNVLDTSQGTYTFDDNTVEVGDRITAVANSASNGAPGILGITIKRTRL